MRRAYDQLDAEVNELERRDPPEDASKCGISM
jgi:hypothetical protein